MNQAERDNLVVRHLKLVTAIAVDFQSAAAAAQVEWDDVLGAGALGLVRAADRWRPDKGRFSAYCRKWVRGAIRRECRLRRPATTGLDLSSIPDHRKAAVPSLEPLFPITSYVPGSKCPHREPLRRTVFVCAVCWSSAWDRHPDLQLGPRDLHPGRRRRHAADIPVPVMTESRRQRRQRLFGDRVAG